MYWGCNYRQNMSRSYHRVSGQLGLRMHVLYIGHLHRIIIYSLCRRSSWCHVRFLCFSRRSVYNRVYVMQWWSSQHHRHHNLIDRYVVSSSSPRVFFDPCINNNVPSTDAMSFAFRFDFFFVFIIASCHDIRTKNSTLLQAWSFFASLLGSVQEDTHPYLECVGGLLKSRRPLPASSPFFLSTWCICYSLSIYLMP